jgi:type II secretory pathway component GspD/PulD (secretin)
VSVAGFSGGLGGQQQQGGFGGGGGGFGGVGGLGGGTGGFGGAGGAGGTGGGGASTIGGFGAGLKSTTRQTGQAYASLLVSDFFRSLGVNLAPPKSVFFNDREGTLIVRATLEDLDIIQAAVQVLNIAPPMINIKSKFVEVSQNDARALGFDWYIGNYLMGGGKVGVQAGGAPPYNGVPTAANPSGAFPVQGTSPNSANDINQLLTTGLRGSLPSQPATPALGTLTGILTDPQFRVVIRALEQRDGSDLLTEASVTTESGRQTQIQVTDLQTIVIGTSLNQTASGGVGTVGAGAIAGGGGGVIGSQVNYPTETLPFGPTLDVVPYVSADGYTISLTMIPSFVEFLGYDDPGAFVPQIQGGSSGPGGVAQPITAQLPLPHFRVRQVVTSVIVWDGQTVVLGGLLAESVTKMKDKIPVLGDLPFLGRLFRSESSQTKKRNLMVFVTPTIIDPAGNRAHSEDEMPFAQNAIPVQKPFVPGTQ